MMRKFNKILCLALASSLMFSLCGCGEITNEEEVIELLEPVGVSQEFAEATIRDIVTASVYSGFVVPEVSEVSFNSSQNFLGYGALPGTSVKKGDAVVLASTTNLDDQIKSMTERISSARESFLEMSQESEKNITEIKNNISYYEQVNKNFASMSEEDKANYLVTANGAPSGYDSEYAKYKLLLTQSRARLQRAEEQLKETTELYDLDSAYNQKKLNQLRNNRKDLLATSSIDGTVVSIAFFDNYQWIEKDTSVAAVADFSELCIKSEYINKSEIKRAVDYYAIINGKRFDVSYQEMDSEEYNRLLAKNDVVYSTFYINDPENEVRSGDFVNLILIKTKKEDVVTVPKDAINKDDEGTFVYKYVNGSTEYVSVKTGVTFGSFTEITSGINAGDKVVSTQKAHGKGTETVTLEKGDFLHEFSATGYLYYPKREDIVNPVQYGTAYIQELCVENYQLVQKGDVIAKITVSPNTIEIERQERKLLRAEEELAKLVKNNKDGGNDKQIKLQQETIDDIAKYIADLKKDASTTEIKAPFTGIVTQTSRWEAGNIIRYNEKLAQIADESNSYVVVEDSAGQLTYGNEARISYKDASGVDKTVIGEVITMTPYALSKDLKTGYALIRVSAEDLESMAGSSMGYEGWWNRNRFTVSVYSRSTKNVLLVPKKAVTKDGDATYVTVLNENNEPEYVSFVAGGNDNSYYWVAEGLTEGTKVCLE